jgi:hypothetical protein
VPSALGIDTARAREAPHQVCKKCNLRRRLLQFQGKFEEFSLSGFLTPQAIDEVDNFVKSLSLSDWLDQVFLGIEIARMAAYEVILEHKLNSLDIQSHVFDQIRDNARSAALVATAVDELICREQPDAVIVYNALYSANRSACLVAQRRGVNAWALHAGLNLQHRFSQLFIYPFNTVPGFSYTEGPWQVAKSQPACADSIRKATDHFHQLLRATNRFVYSSPAGHHNEAHLRSLFGIKDGVRVLVATLSSEDEILAARTVGLEPPPGPPPTFDSLHDWLSFLITYVSDNPTLHLVVRVHPREFPNKRETKLSANAIRLKGLLAELPPNVTVNWPEDAVSLYDLAQFMDVCVNYTSSAGIEMMMLGIPTVTPRTPFMGSYDPDISYVVHKRDNFVQTVEDALSDGWSIENTRMALRWWSHLLSDLPIDISDAFTYPAGGFIPATTSTERRSLRTRAMQFAARNAPPLLETKHVLSRRHLKNIDRAVAVLGTNDDSARPLPSAGQATTRAEDKALASALSPIVDELEAIWGEAVGPLIGLKAFVQSMTPDA